MKKTVRIDEHILMDLKDLLIKEYGMAPGTAYTATVNKAISLLLYGTIDVDRSLIIQKRRLQELGATEEDYLKGRVRTWARDTLFRKDAQVVPTDSERFSPKLKEVLKEVIIEEQGRSERFIDSKDVIRTESEEVSPFTYSSPFPPWEDMKKVDWSEVDRTFSKAKSNPFVTWAKREDGSWDKLKREAVMIALAHVPPKDRSSPDVWKLIRELHSIFLSWKEPR